MDFWRYVCVILNTVTLTSCWQYFTDFRDLIMDSSEKEQAHLHSVYYFGKCNTKAHMFYDHVYLDALQVLGKLIVRGWIDIPRIPTCIELRAYSHSEDMFRSTAFQFQICVPRITYCHSKRRYKYFYYEWYIPPDLIGGMNWSILFYGPRTLDWQ